MYTEIINYINQSKIIIQERIQQQPFYDELKRMQCTANYENLIEFCYFLKTKDMGKCQYNDCKNKTTFISFKRGYNVGCCEDHTKRLNNLKKYGVENVMQHSIIKIKQQNSMFKNHGYLHALQNPESLEKMKKTQTENGGIGAKNKRTLDKMKETNIKRLGVENPMQHKETRKKFEDSMFTKYGTKHALENIEIKQKQEKTNFTRYGASHHMLSSVHKNKLKIKFIKSKLDKISFRVSPLFKLTDYNDIEQDLAWSCNECNSEFIDNLDNGKIPRCLNCFPLIYNGVSNAEKELLQFLELKESIILNDRTILNGKELDIYIPDKKLAIEFNGIYWHSEANGKDNNYHLDKTLKCEAQGIELIHIFDQEWIEKKEIIKSMIYTKLGYFDKTVQANECNVKEINKEQKRDFLDSYHLKGNDDSSIHLGLFNKRELVSVITFAKSNESDLEYTLLRFSIKTGLSIIDGFNKLFEYFINTYQPNKITGYDDKSFSECENYNKLGFKKIGNLPPRPWYFKGNSGLLDTKEVKMRLSEYDRESDDTNIQFQDYNRIWDCGYDIYEWNKP